MYKEMIDKARKDGKASEKAMNESICLVDDLLRRIKSSHPDVYSDFIRESHEIMYGKHYNDEYAKREIEMMHYTDKEHAVHEGEHWTKEDVVTAWIGKTFPPGTTDCDKWVAANTMYCDLNKSFGEQEILDAAYLVYFADEDYDGDGKIWRVMHS